jgi:hypothetical protein
MSLAEGTDPGMVGLFPIGWILVTGGCGFIGSNFVRHLREADRALEITNRAY